MSAPESAELPSCEVESWLTRAADVALRVVGALVSLVGGLLAAVLALFLVPLRVDTPFGMMRVPLAVGFVVVAYPLLIWFAQRTTGVRWAALLPLPGWLVVVLLALGGTRQGAYLLVPDDWVGALTLFGGTAALAVGVVRAIMRRA